MSEEEHYKLSENIMNLDSGIRFVTIIGNQGQILYGGKRENIENYLDLHDQKLSAEHVLKSWKLRKEFEDAIGKTKFVMAQYEKIRRYTIPIDENRLLYITTEPNLSNDSFIQNILDLIETFKKSP